MDQKLPIAPVKNEVIQQYEYHLFSATKAQMNIKPSVLERGDQDLSIKGSISLKYQPCLNRSGKKRG